MTGTGRLIRLILRRDRVLLPLWVVPLGLLPAGYIASFNGVFTTAQERIDYAHVSQHNAGFVGLYGILPGTSLAEIVAWRSGFMPVMIGLFALLTVVRHTRTDEEAGRTELIGSAAISRHAQLAAALVTTCAASLVLGLLVVAAMTGTGMPATGSLAFGAEFTLAGWAFAGVAAVTAQLTSSARSARAIAVAVLGVAYTLRVGGDISATGDGKLSWLSWLSPIGWVTHIFPYSSNDWWPAELTVLFAAATAGLGVVLLGRRDLGAGLLPAGLGRPGAPGWLRSPLALAWRLHRGLLLGWTVGFALLGLVFGGVAGSIVDLVGNNSGLAGVFGRLGGTQSLVDSYFAGIAGMVGLIAAAYAVQATLRMRDEEQTGHAEAVLSTAVGRYAWAGSHLVFSLLGPALALFAEGLVAGLTYPSAGVGGVIGSTMVQLPAVWVETAVAVLLFGVLPKWSMAAWAAPAISLLILLVGGITRLNHWLLDISPFTHVPHVPGGDVAATPLITLTVVAVAVGAAGLVGLRRRNLPD